MRWRSIFDFILAVLFIIEVFAPAPSREEEYEFPSGVRASVVAYVRDVYRASIPAEGCSDEQIWEDIQDREENFCVSEYTYVLKTPSEETMLVHVALDLDGTLLIELGGIAKDAVSRVDEFLYTLQEQGRFGEIRRVVVNLMGNLGGELEPLFQISCYFAPTRQAILFAKGKGGTKFLYTPERPYGGATCAPADLGLLSGYLTVVIVDRHTSSAATMLARLLVNQGALVIGEHTDEKGVVQNVRTALLPGYEVRVDAYDVLDPGTLEPTNGIVLQPHEVFEPADRTAMLERAMNVTPEEVDLLRSSQIAAVH